MARWKLTEPHYLAVEGTKWEYSEVDRVTGRPKRTQFPVPLHLDPNVESDWTHRYDAWTGDVIVSNGQGTQDPKDLIFTGPVTPGMLPMDDEAKAITAKAAKDRWKPTADLSPEAQNQSFTNQLLSGFIDEMTSLKTNVAAAPQVAGMEAFMESMTQMMKMQTEILAKLAEKQPAPGRRVA
jgi:hypothetical protein